MLKHSALLAIAASVTVGVTMLAPTDASARYGGGIGNHARFNHVRVGPIAYRFNHPRFYNYGRFYHPRFFAYRPYGWRWGVRPAFCWRHPFFCRAHFGGYRIGAVPLVRPVPVVAAPAVPGVGCLRQIRLADGSSLFRNLCTNEAAITSNLPEGEPPAPLK
jgi:hypothetical protein